LVFAAIRVRCCDRTANFTALRERAASFTRARDLETFVAATGRVNEIGLPAFAFLVADENSPELGSAPAGANAANTKAVAITNAARRLPTRVMLISPRPAPPMRKPVGRVRNRAENGILLVRGTR
jgi:hypothetical protein